METSLFRVGRPCLSLITCAIAVILAGCGGSNGGGTSKKARTPTDVTRARVQNMHSMVVNGLSQSGYQNSGIAPHFNGIFNSRFGSNTPIPPKGSESGVGNGSPTTSAASHPRLNSFFRDVAMTPRKSRATNIARISRQAARDGMTLTPDSPLPDDNIPAPKFYFDYYLGLWVAIDDLSGKSVYLLFEDEAKTKPAGKIETTYAVDSNTFPQIYESTYEFNAGTLAGSHGFSKSVTNTDYSGSMTYENHYNDSFSDKGASSWTGAGDYTWHSRTELTGGVWFENSGSFRANGSGGTRTSGSDGYTAIYIYNADGSGRGAISGSDPGLPVTIIWDAFGNTTIVYADGTTERLSGWGVGEGGETPSEPVPVSTDK
jgi:hypothetical protein